MVAFVLIIVSGTCGYGFGHWLGKNRPWKNQYWPILLLYYFVMSVLGAIGLIYYG